jgi:arginine deiminase
MKYPLHVTSEIGELKAVLLHRPGREIENLMPEHLERLLFDDIPYLPAMQKEHDYFASVLRNEGVEVLYLEKLAAEALHSEEIRQRFVDQVLKENQLGFDESGQHLREYLLGLSSDQLVESVISGVRKTEVPKSKNLHLYELMNAQYPFYLDPMPNLYFTRDPAAAIGNGISINRMNREIRRRESLFLDYIVKYHPRFAKHSIPLWYDRTDPFSMEGGDQLVLSPQVVAVGVSERTNSHAVEALARRLFQKSEGFRQVIAIEIPKMRAFMHLDTVFTMVDRDKFTVHPEVFDAIHEMEIFVLEPDEEDQLRITRRTNLAQTLREVLGLTEIDLIPCGGGDSVAAAREQWNDGSNTLAIAPGVVVTYDRNSASNQALREHGVQVIEIPGSELGRGRGGPRCMSMPLVRDDVVFAN